MLSRLHTLLYFIKYKIGRLHNCLTALVVWTITQSYNHTIDFIYKLHSYNGFYNFLSTKKRSFLKLIYTLEKGLRGCTSLVNLSFFFLFFLPLSLSAQNTCPACEVAIPDSLQVDTFFLQDLSDGSFQVPYEGNLSFRLPVNTTEVLYLDPSLPSNINISSIRISSISNLPAGLIWEANQSNYSLPEDRNGCVRICGTPLQFGLFEVDITVTAQVSILSRDATFNRTLYIAPPNSDNQGFSMTNNIGCGRTQVAFENNNPSNGQAGFSYQWDFGNGDTSNEETPAEQVYDQPGVYPVSYQVIIDTIGATLTDITIIDSDCNDIFGKPDFYIRLYDALDTLVLETALPDNTNPPISLPLNFRLASDSYRLEVWDNDSGLGFDDDLCGTVHFESTIVDTLKEGDLTVKVSIIHTPDTVQVVDSVIVFELPTIPTIQFESANFCNGDSMLLTSSYTENVAWFFEGLPIVDARQASFVASTSGEYHVSHTSLDGCVIFSEPIFLETIEIPGAPVFSNNENVLSLFNPAILENDFSLQWYQEDNLLEETGLEICVSENGLYGLELIDEATGCRTLFETSIVVDAAIDCTSATNDLQDYITQVTLSPNPTSGALIFDIDLENLLVNVKLSIVNVLGQSVYESSFDRLQGSHTFQLDLSDRGAGMYWVILESREGLSSWKVLKR